MKKRLIFALRRFKAMLAKGSGDYELVPDSKQIKKVDEWIASKGYYRYEDTMDNVADSLGLSRAELSWICRIVYGDNFMTLRKRLRLVDASRMLLDEPDLPVVVIAEQVGIQDRTNFRRQFYEEFGVSPQEWRRRHIR